MIVTFNNFTMDNNSNSSGTDSDPDQHDDIAEILHRAAATISVRDYVSNEEASRNATSIRSTGHYQFLGREGSRTRLRRSIMEASAYHGGMPPPLPPPPDLGDASFNGHRSAPALLISPRNPTNQSNSTQPEPSLLRRTLLQSLAISGPPTTQQQQQQQQQEQRAATTTGRRHAAPGTATTASTRTGPHSWHGQRHLGDAIDRIRTVQELRLLEEQRLCALARTRSVDANGNEVALATIVPPPSSPAASASASGSASAPRRSGSSSHHSEEGEDTSKARATADMAGTAILPLARKDTQRATAA